MFHKKKKKIVTLKFDKTESDIENHFDIPINRGYDANVSQKTFEHGPLRYPFQIFHWFKNVSFFEKSLETVNKSGVN